MPEFDTSIKVTPAEFLRKCTDIELYGIWIEINKQKYQDIIVAMDHEIPKPDSTDNSKS
jgi:hypothetical protein